MAEKNQYRYRCAEGRDDPGHVRCDFEYAAEDQAEVRAEAARHRIAVHEVEDTNPEIIEGQIELMRLHV